MIRLNYPLTRPGRVRLAGAPEGFDALALAVMVREAPGVHLHIARDEQRMTRAAEALRFFAPDAEVIELPAWDCLPYDRVSPNGEVLARRIATLVRLASGSADGRRRLVLTTVSAVLQRVPPRQRLAAAVYPVRVGDRIDLEHLLAFLTGNGYARAGTVREPGEFAVRGGIVDIFPPGCAEPLRLDLFGDELEGLRSFDSVSQRSSGARDSVTLMPVSEVILDEAAIRRFRGRYRELFGAVRGDDPLYESVSAGRRYAGLEHWLPLFHERLETMFDYLGDAALTLDDQAEEAVAARLELIADYYEARRGVLDAASKRRDDQGAPVYKPVPPELLYLTANDWEGLLGARAVGQLTPFPAPEAAAIDLGGRRVRDFTEARARRDLLLFDAVRERVVAEVKAGRRVVFAASTSGARERLAGLLGEHGVADLVEARTWADVERLPAGAVALVVLGLEHGFAADGLTVYAEQDVLGERLIRPPRRGRRAEDFITEVSALSTGDPVVHVDHGIGRYDGLETLSVAGAPHDCVRILYAGDDKLYVPVENLDVLSRYGSEETGVQLDRLGRADWQARKARVKARILNIAAKLLEVAAARQLRQVEAWQPPAGLYDDFAVRFPYQETEDQARAIDDTMEDLAAGRPMDRLICGDVGFGKTEVALRAAFVAAMSGQQVAVVVPTTLLARQHWRAFCDRFAGLPVRVEQLSRLVAGQRARAVRDGLADGDVDIVIGTHALLAKSIRFKRLGLLVVDEEQHFGVTQKERLKALSADVHVLTLTATPIPRTLQMALAGVRDMSLIATPPVDRIAVRTFVLPYDPVILREAIMREHFRGGQVFYVCPRIEDLPKAEERLRELVPEVKIAVAHGRLSASALERVMAAFYDRRFDLLLSTNIIESGLDIPTANTLIVHRADMFGLAQLYQLRGWVGRAKIRAYAYFTVPVRRVLREAAQKRLEMMQTLDSLGAGFSLASHDLDIRGAGNLLGEQQSGHIREVGVELYQHMLDEAVAAARDTGGAEVEEWTPTITVGTPVLIPEAYVADLGVRLGLYRRLARLVDQAEIEAFATELIDRFGALPAEVENLLEIVALKRLCREAGVERLDAGPKGAVLAFYRNRFADPAGLVAFINAQAGRVKLRPDHRLAYRRDWVDGKRRLQGVRRLMQQLAGIAAGAEASAAE